MSQKRKKTSTKKPMHPAFIKAHIEVADSSIIKIARSMGLCPSSVANVVHHKCASRRVALKIAEVTQLPLETLFGGLYPSNTVEPVEASHE